MLTAGLDSCCLLGAVLLAIFTTGEALEGAGLYDALDISCSSMGTYLGILCAASEDSVFTTGDGVALANVAAASGDSDFTCSS